MPKKILTSLLPAFVAGCAGFPSAPPPQTPALVFVDGQILDSANIIAQTQRRMAPSVNAPGAVTASAPSPRAAGGVTTSATPPASPVIPAPSSAAPVGARALANLRQTGTPGNAPVIALAPARNLTVAQWIQKLLPAGWQRLQANATTPALNTRLASWEANDQWTRSLSRLLTEQHLYGTLDWDNRALTVTTLPGAAVQPAETVKPAAPSASGGKPAQPASPRNPFTQTAASSAPRWTAAAGTTLRETLVRWAGTASCSSPAGGFWTIIWPDTVADYRLDAPLTFSGTFEEMLGQVFTLYATADTPLRAKASRRQCVVAVSDQSAH